MSLNREIILKNKYFSNESKFAKDILFAAPGAIAGHIATLINDRQTHGQPFESCIDDLTAALGNDETAKQDFFAMLESIKAQGHVEMVMQKQKKHQYHTEAHSAEIQQDTDQRLAADLGGDDLSSNIVRELASTAAAWHDVVQDKGPPNNELESAVLFVKEMQSRLNAFAEKYPDCKPALDALQENLDFISKEFIVYDTWLVVGLEDKKSLFAKTLLQHAEKAMQEIDIKPEYGPHMQTLVKAANTIEANDTRRFADNLIAGEQHILSKLDDIKDSAGPLKDFLAKLPENEQEVFLGLMGQNIRMFTELNMPYTPDESQHGLVPITAANISEEDYSAFVDALNNLRADNGEPADYQQLFDVFMDTVNYKRPDRDKGPIIEGESNFIRERGFAAAQQHEIWDKHAQHLDLFQEFYAGLNNQQKSQMGHSLLTVASRFQPGVAYLNDNQAFKDALAQSLETVTEKIDGKLNNPDQTTASVSSLGTFGSNPAKSDIAKLLQAKQNLESCMQQYNVPALTSDGPQPLQQPITPR